MAESYGKLPTDVLDQPASDFWMNARIHAATQSFKKDARDRGPKDQDVEQLQKEADDRADLADDVGGDQVDPGAQRSALRQLQDQAEGVNN